MDTNPVIFDISSDEEPTFDDPSGVGGGGEDDDDDRYWLTRLLETFDKETAADSDEVVVVGEHIPPKPKAKPSAKPVKSFVEVEEEDCVVLEGDPDKPLDVSDDAADDSDDVLVVGQKGQIACRDYPHPRHLCAKFPFSSTPHEKHCHLCHCYVCDSLAPCAHWSTGSSSINHCHATDKQEIWKIQRKSFRLGKNSPTPVSKFPAAHLSVAVPTLNQVEVVPLDITQLTPSMVKQNQPARLTTIRSCSARLTIPNIISQSRNKRTGCAQGTNGLLPRKVSQQAISVRNNTILRDRGPFISSNKMFKRPGIIRGAVAMNQSVYGSSNNLNCASAPRYHRNVVSLAAANSESPGWQDVLPNMISDTHGCPSFSQPNMGTVNVNTVSPRTEVYSQPIPQSNCGQNIYQFANRSQNVVGSSFPGFDIDWIGNLSQSNQQNTTAENICLAGTGANMEPMAVNQFSSQVDGSTELHHKDQDYENWLFGESDAVVSEGCVPADLNVFCPEPAVFDTLFDFESTWNGLAQV